MQLPTVHCQLNSTNRTEHFNKKNPRTFLSAGIHFLLKVFYAYHFSSFTLNESQIK